MATVLAGKPPLDIATFHHYALPGGSWAGPPSHPKGWQWKVDDVVAAALSNVTETDVKGYVSTMKRAGFLGTPLWLGEGATTYSQPLDQSFATLYNYLNILKQTGLNGVKLFAKQSLPDFFAKSDGQPTPLYYFALLWKRLMGRTVYRADSTVEGLILAARSRKSASTQELSVVPNSTGRDGGFVLAAANLGSQPVTLTLRGVHCILYLLTATDNDPTGVGTDLNGVKLSANSSTGVLPNIQGKLVSCGEIRLLPMSAGFITAS